MNIDRINGAINVAGRAISSVRGWTEPDSAERKALNDVGQLLGEVGVFANGMANDAENSDAYKARLITFLTLNLKGPK